ncbi:MAG TPA: glycosyl hydrolase [Micromonosporaceae bacterium]|nr:glycosyl hydrolase [Micromonosporaceae bacterium]
MTPELFPPPGKAFLGVATAEGPYDLGPVDAFTSATGYSPAVLMFFQGWAVNPFDRTVFDRVADRGMLPMLSWEPWDYRATGPGRPPGEQPAYRLSRIAGGDFDEYLTSWARGVKALGYQVPIRFAHEMNGFWYPWCELANGNRPGDYVAAYRHVHDVFTRAGATNARWVWSPNVSYPGAEPLHRLYPGDDYVDWAGVSGYYGTPGHEDYVPFDDVFAATFDELRALTGGKPLVVTETGATDTAGLKASWVTGMFACLPRHRDLLGVIWFEAVGGPDYRVATSEAAAKAFGAGAADPRYRTAWVRGHALRTAAGGRYGQGR